MLWSLRGRSLIFAHSFGESVEEICQRDQINHTFLKECCKFPLEEGDGLVGGVIALLFSNPRGGTADQTILGCWVVGLLSEQRGGGGGRAGQKRTRRGEGSTAGQSLRGDTLERQAKWPVKVRDSAPGFKDCLFASVEVEFKLHRVLFQ